MERFETFSFQISFDFHYNFSQLNDVVKDCDKKLMDINKLVEKQGALVKIHNNFFRGQNSKFDENFVGCKEDGFFVFRPLNRVQPFSSSGDKVLSNPSSIRFDSENDDSVEDS